MKKKRIGIGIGTIVIIVGLILGDVQIKLGSNQPQASTRIIRTKIADIQDIS